MKNKFKMQLTWHNCYDYPPTEPYNDNLWATDGRWVFPVEYDQEHGWREKGEIDYWPLKRFLIYYWADLEQTVRGCSEFKGE